MIFEITDKDLAGRIGKLETKHGIVETPTIMPVINPNIPVIEPSALSDFGAEIIITNSYIIYRKESLKEIALKKGLHKLLDFKGPIMTDSGSYQLSVYGELEITNDVIIEFQQSIGSDIGVPLDIPTPPFVHRSRVERELEITNSRIIQAKESAENSDMLLAAPIQGSTFLDLRKKSAECLSKIGFDIYPIGAVVPLLEDYRYKNLVDVIVHSKIGLPPSAPVHLFGAGHPMMFALCVALGCDLFDSAAYALYARDGRYLTPYGTYHLKDLKYLPCNCPICSKYSAEDLKAMEKEKKEELLARHNLYATFMEIKLVKQSIKEGSLWELVERRCRAHPKLLGGLKQL
ncbi:MAG: tRNA guanosine(15) transglycosylase TgtA, partial [Methanosarcinales archaeon]